jgi:hypothetical protein
VRRRFGMSRVVLTCWTIEVVAVPDVIYPIASRRCKLLDLGFGDLPLLDLRAQLPVGRCTGPPRKTNGIAHATAPNCRPKCRPVQTS